MTAASITALAPRPAGPPPRVVCATTRVVAFDPMALLRCARRAGLGEVSLWDGLEADGRRWSFVGFGAAARVEASGSARCERIRRAATGLLEHAVELGDADPALPELRWIGGLAFRPEAFRAAPWSGFADASFRVPRWVFATSNDGTAFVRVTAALDDRSPSADVVAELRRALSLVERLDGQSTAHVRPALDVAPDDAEAWRRLVGEALRSIHDGCVQKVVTSSVAHVRASRVLDAAAVIEHLRATQRTSTTFAIEQSGSVLVGASPELLVAVHDRRMRTEAVAGTLARRTASHGRELLASDKDRREHALVVRALLEASCRHCIDVVAPSVPTIRTLPTIFHLVTPITGILQARRHILDLVADVHPSPAICGFPRDAAETWLDRFESHDRGWYTGAVGWFDARGDGHFVVAIRCGLLAGADAWVYAGAGIVRGSDHVRELEEVQLKRAVLLDALGETS